MELSEFLKASAKYFLDNLPQIIGIAVATLLLAFVGWIINRKKNKTSDGEPAKPSLLQDEVSTQYVHDLIRRGSTLSFGDPASWTVGSSENEGLVTLDQIWTPLRVADSQTRKNKVGTHENMAEKDVGTDLKSLFESTKQPLLILGEPGSGKSTSLAMFAVDAARNWSNGGGNPLPIWVSLSSVTSDDKTNPELVLLSGVPEIGLAMTRSGFEKGTELNSFLFKAISDGTALLLLDGLDEVKEHMLPRVRKAISHILGLQKGTHVIVTCRKFDYRQTAPNRKVPIERELELLPYTPEEQRLYVERWYAAAVRIGRFTGAQASDLGTSLIQELRGDEISDLAESPLLLALLTLIHSEEAKLPDSRAVVSDRAISYMLADSAKWRGREAGSATLAKPPVLALARELAYQSHVREELADGIESFGVTGDMVNQLAVQICDVMKQAETTKNVPSSNDLAQRFLNSHGFLLDTGNGRFKFAHRSFREFLVGQYFAAGAHHSEALSKAPSLYWREPFRLMASFAGHEGENLFYILSLIGNLLSAEDISSIQLGGEMLAEIGRRRLALRQFSGVLEKDGLWARAQSKIAKQVEDPSLPLPVRERSATVLGALGDPRFDLDEDFIGPWAHFIDLAAGPANVGSERLDKRLVLTSGGFAGDVRSIEFEPFCIGRYPVTNVEFRAFVDDDGYTNLQYWQSEFARGWVSGDQKILKTIREHWLSTVYEHHAKEIRDGEIDTKRLEEESDNRIASRKAPYYWLDKRFNRPNQPVVGINFWESVAYCEWATQKGYKTHKLDPDYIIRLQTEFEWERACRRTDDDRIYPWGDQWSEEKAHVSTNILNMRQPAPVGIYLEAWPGGPCDLAGNVWEWTDSLHLPYSPEYDALRISPDSLEERVVRGSSWYNTSIMAACSVRAVDRSYNLFYDVGFRVVCFHLDSKRAGSS